jgi:poly(3-hydroxybutyrate) depolymerase
MQPSRVRGVEVDDRRAKDLVTRSSRLRRRPRRRTVATRLALPAIVLAVVLGAADGEPSMKRSDPATASGTRLVTLRFRGPGGHEDAVVVAMPAWYGPRRHPALPLIISPHGRGGTARGNARRWGDLPGRLGVIVLNAGLSGRVLQRDSWAWPPEIEGLARLPRLVRQRVHYLRFDSRRIYAAGDSMGGQEALMLLARHPRLLAAVAAADPVTNFLERERQFARSADSRGEKRRARVEVGASPQRAPWLYLRRSPYAYAATIASAGVPTRLWWSRLDRVVIEQQKTQAGELFTAVKRRNPDAPISERITDDRHGWIFWSDHGLPEMTRWLLRHRRRVPTGSRERTQRGPRHAASSSRRAPA